jgi:hypothetical protein
MSDILKYSCKYEETYEASVEIGDTFTKACMLSPGEKQIRAHG